MTGREWVDGLYTRLGRKLYSIIFMNAAFRILI